MRQATLTLLAAVAALLVAAAAGAGDTIYKYKTPDGNIEYGTDPPPGAIILEEAGTVSQGGGPPGVELGTELREHIRQRATTDMERVIAELTEEPVVTGLFVAAVFLWAVVVLCAFPPVFKTMDIDTRGALLMIGAIFAGVVTLAVIGYGLELVYGLIGWSPRMEWGEKPIAITGWVLYALVVVYAFWKRLGVRFPVAVMFALLWLVLVVAFAVAMWIFVVPRVTPLLAGG